MRSRTEKGNPLRRTLRISDTYKRQAIGPAFTDWTEQNQKDTVCPAGTSLSVKNLFFNVPARRNFLKKDSIEFSHIEEVFRRITLIHYDLGFTLTNNGKVVYDLKAGSLLQRISGLYGNAYKERMYSVEEETDLVKIRGFVSRPEYSRRTRGEQYIFVNGRYIKHPALNAAVERAYGDLLPDRSYPSYFIGLTVDPSKIDINIHPTKTEVRFVDEHALFAILRSAVKRALGQFSLATELSFDTPEEFNLPPAPKDYTPIAPHVKFDPHYNPFRSSGSQSKLKLENPETFKTVENIDLPDFEKPVSPPTMQETESVCLQVQGRYIVTTLSSGLALIDQHRALIAESDHLRGHRHSRRPQRSRPAGSLRPTVTGLQGFDHAEVQSSERKPLRLAGTPDGRQSWSRPLARGDATIGGRPLCLPYGRSIALGQVYHHHYQT